MARSSKLFGPGLEQPSLAQIAAFITNNVCVEGDCQHLGESCDGCANPFCKAHSNVINGLRLCSECEKNVCPDGCGFYSDHPREQAKHRCGA